ncbi:MAG: N-acetylmuramoyl-L-alanine amidase [Lachnospiraceae bacterium]|nr:N-acetylmuramoyl-L-alanine amidase [Lachnospiraceae bacterium]
MHKGWLEMIMGLGMVFLITALFRGVNQTGAVVIQEGTEHIVVLDAGHGGIDPGKVGVDGTLEKDINLSLVYKLKEMLEAADVTVVLTRGADVGLYQETDTNKKRADMNARCKLIEATKPDLTVSIHQNSYHEEYVKGAQVFYYKGSEEGQHLAQILQKGFDRVLGEENTRQAKANDQYYLLLHTSCPIVIVECGFLSNWEESAKLADDAYQEQLAWAIHLGILQYLNET